LGGEVGLARGQFGSGLLQGFEPFLQMTDVRVQIGGDESGAIGSKRDGVEAGLLAGQFAAQLDESAAQLLQGEHGIGGRRPRDELHALEELEDTQRIDAIGLGAGQSGTLEVFDRPWIDDHDFHPRGSLQAVNASGFQTNAGGGTTAGEQLEQLPVTGGRIGQGAGTFGRAVAEDRHD
jgi:hypothetical protein